MPDWQPGVRGLLHLTGPLDQPGTTYVLDQPGPRLRIEVLEVEAPRLHRQLEAFAWFGWIGTATFEPLPDGTTKFTYEYASRPGVRVYWPPLMALSAFFFGRAEVDQLKKVAERSTLN